MRFKQYLEEAEIIKISFKALVKYKTRLDKMESKFKSLKGRIKTQGPGHFGNIGDFDPKIRSIEIKMPKLQIMMFTRRFYISLADSFGKPPKNLLVNKEFIKLHNRFKVIQGEVHMLWKEYGMDDFMDNLGK